MERKVEGRNGGKWSEREGKRVTVAGRQRKRGERNECGIYTNAGK